MAKGDYLTTAQAADLIGMTAGTLQRWVRQGLITPTFVTPAGHARWTEEDLRRQLAPKSRQAD